MHIDNLIIEITRSCNMICPHCLRGPAQNKRITKETIAAIFKNISSISNLTLTGGEPSLAIAEINMIIEEIKKQQIELNSFYIATNAKKVSDEFMMSLLRLYLLCDDKEMCTVKVSTAYHEKPKQENIDKLSAFKFVQIEPEITYMKLLGQGFATDNFENTREVIVYEYDLDDDSILDGDIFFNSMGDFKPSCDLSYETQDQLNFGNVNDPNFDLMCAVEMINDRIQERDGHLTIGKFIED